MRIGEICALKWKDIDFHNGSVSVTKTVKRLKNNNDTVKKTSLVVTEPKSTSSYRIIPLPEIIIRYFKNFYVSTKDNYYIFSEKILIPLDPRTLQYAYKKVLSKCNVNYKNFHCLRHTFATRCITIEWDVKTLSEILGHSDIKVTMEYYFHSSFEYKKQQMNKLKLIS